MKRGKFLRSIFGAAAAMIAGPPVVGALVVEKSANKKYLDAIKPLDHRSILPRLQAEDVVGFYQKHGVLISQVHFYRESYEFSDGQPGM